MTPYEKIEVAGVGGLATVWKATDTRSGELVALKIIKPDVSFSNERFLEEVQTMAILDHPRILNVRDYGIGEEPYMALDWIDGGTLGTLPILSFSVLRDVLLCVLDALAHSHARGVIHRDLKPDNVLVVSANPLEIRLADFGIAHAVDRSVREEEPRMTGTPRYMSPEQFQNRWRTFGPPTDLYALGCMAFEMVQGVAPFVGKSIIDLANLHTTAAPPKLNPRFSVPEQFESWLEILLEKEPDDRFQFAADAAFSLARMRDLSDVDTQTFDTRSLPTLGGEGGEETDPTVLINDPLPTPQTWDREPDTLLHTVANIFSMRRPSTVGRSNPQARLWEVLNELNGFTRFMITGEHGVGKTHLLRWFGERAHETGRANVHWAFGDSSSHSLSVLRQVLQSKFQTWRLATSEIENIINARLPRDVEDRDRVIAASVGIIADGYANVGLSRMKLIEYAVRVLVHDAKKRPVLLLVDDSRPSAVESLTDVIQTKFPLANILLVCTQVESPSDVETIRLTPFHSEDRDEFLQRNGVATPQIKSRVANAHAFLPFDLVQAVADGLETGVNATTSDALKSRLSRFFDSFSRSGDVRHLLDHFATYGEQLLKSEVLEIADALGVEIPSEFFDRMIRMGFWSRTETGFVFTNPLIRSATSSKLGVVHQKCAEIKLERARLPSDYSELADHFSVAQDFSRAAWALRERHRLLIEMGQTADVAEMFSTREGLIRRSNDDLEQKHYWAQRASYSVLTAAQERSFAEQLIADGHPDFLAIAHLFLANEKLVAGEDALPDFEAAVKHSEGSSDPQRHEILWYYGAYLTEIGRLFDALVAFEKIPDDTLPSIAQQKFNGLAIVEVQRLNFSSAEALLNRSEKSYVFTPYRTRAEGAQEHIRGMLRIAERRFDEAEEIVQATLEVWDRTGIAPNRKLIYGLRGIIALFQNDLETADRILAESRDLDVFWPSHRTTHGLADIWVWLKRGDVEKAIQLWADVKASIVPAAHQHTIMLVVWEEILDEFPAALPDDFASTFERLLRTREEDQSVPPFR